ncbi:hypothetical protein AVEN_250496-1 [Araneus ventricosus]|uniref:Uncharacterized protein n=1 Tax=Araneus ventricosus TaxID=182803 RepID=A0A4Y2FEP6_ARAVE|nr:hypothetical protein AVEN_250496-1 [Araneus ventricosus]
MGRGGLVVRSPPRDRRVPDSKPDFTKEPPCKRVWHTSNPSGPNALPPERSGSLERGYRLRCHPRHLTTTQNYKVRSKIAFVLLQNRK